MNYVVVFKDEEVEVFYSPSILEAMNCACRIMDKNLLEITAIYPKPMEDWRNIN